MKVALYTHPQKDEKLCIAEMIADMASSLCPPVQVLFDKELFEKFSLDEQRKATLCEKMRICDLVGTQQAIKSCDLVISIGGDGTFLGAARLACMGNVPVLGVNSGRIGYLAELEKQDVNELTDILSHPDSWLFESRMMLSCDVVRDGTTVSRMTALNEIAVTKGVVSRMIDVDIRTSNTKICTYRADGFIVSTPTGSTAYAMSAGGPIIDPSIECLLTLPVCPYLAVNASPVIYSPQSVIEIVFADGKGNNAFVTADGKESFELAEGDRVIVKRADESVKLLKHRKIDFCTLLNIKLSEEVIHTP